MDEFKGRWQAQQSEDAGSRLVGGALARSVAECFMAGYQLALDRTFHLQDTRWGALAVSEGFEGHPPVTVDGESALAGSKTWVPGAPYIDTVMIRVGRGRDAMFVQIDLPCGGVTSALREKDGFLDELDIGMIHLDRVPQGSYRVIDAFPVRQFPLMEATSFFAVLMTVADQTGASVNSTLMDESHEMAHISATELNVEDAKQFVESTQCWLRSNPTWAERCLAGWRTDQKLVSMYAGLASH